MGTDPRYHGGHGHFAAGGALFAMIDLTRVSQFSFSIALESNLSQFSNRRKAFLHFLKAVCLHLEAEAAWVYMVQEDECDRLLTYGDSSLCDEPLSRAFAQRKRPEIPHNILLSFVKVDNRVRAVVGIGRKEDFKVGAGHGLNKLCVLMARDLTRREEKRLTRVLDRIREKIVAELRPKDLAYQILDGLRQLVHYDHSSAFLAYDERASILRVEAEKVAWTKAKSTFVGYEIPLDEEWPAFRELAREPRIVRVRGVAADEPLNQCLFRMLDYHTENIPKPTSILCAPLFFDDAFLGFLKIAGWKRGHFQRRDLEIVRRFLPAARVSLRNALVKTSLENRVMEAEMRASLVTLARAVAHDVNNAIGSILPLAKQIRDDVNADCLDPEYLKKDMEFIIEKASLCRRIFSNMLRPGTSHQESGPVDVNKCIEAMKPMLEALAANGTTTLRFDLSSGLKSAHFNEQHLERIIWNLVTNALEALQQSSGTIRVMTGSAGNGSISIAVSDTGPGIPAEALAMVQEPFYSTKPGGTGLGLSICRSLIWQHGGCLRIRSNPDEGTEIRLELNQARRKARK